VLVEGCLGCSKGRLKVLVVHGWLDDLGEAVAEYLAAWAGAAIVAEQRERGRCWVWLRLRRPASIAGTREFLEECPHYTPRSFKVVSG